MHPSVHRTGWFRRRNLIGRPPSSGAPPEATIYAMVTLAVRPGKLPTAAIEHIARNYLAHCVDQDTPH